MLQDRVLAPTPVISGNLCPSCEDHPNAPPPTHSVQMIKQSKDFLHGADIYMQEDEPEVDHSHDNDEEHVYVFTTPSARS